MRLPDLTKSIDWEVVTVCCLTALLVATVSACAYVLMSL
jgi:hypothetical protein